MILDSSILSRSSIVMDNDSDDENIIMRLHISD